MATTPSPSWISHVESFIDTSRTPQQQAASVGAIAELVKKDVLTLEELVKEMELYLTISDHIIRGRGILLLAEVLGSLTSKSLGSASISSLAGFFASRLADWQALRGALAGCLALLRRRSNVGMVVGSEARALTGSFLGSVHVQSLAVHDRKLCFEILLCLLDVYPEAVMTLGEDLVNGICEAIDEEKDPRCLMLTFRLVEILVRLFPDPYGPVASIAEDLFDIIGRYFPIHFTHTKSDDSEINRDDLSRALMNAFCSTPLFEPFAIKLLLEKLSSSLPSAKIDSLKYLNSCIRHYGADRMTKHAKTIWSALKDVILNLPQRTVFSSTSESAADMEPQENVIAKEALICLRMAISQLNWHQRDPFITLILEDQDIEKYFCSVSAQRSYSDICEEGLRQMNAIGSILCAASEASADCCNRVFEKFLTRLMNILGVSVHSSSDGCIADYKTSSGVLNFGALYLCVELLASCRHLTVDAQDFSPLVEDRWWYLLKDFSGPLTYTLRSALVNLGSPGVINERNTEREHVFCSVKGLQVLTTFPKDYTPISEDIYEDILSTLMSVITGRSDDTYLWKLTLKALAQIGLFIEKICDSKKRISYSKVVVERIASLLSCDDCTTSLPLKLEAITEIGITSLEFMLIAIRGLEDAIFFNFSEGCAGESLRPVEILIPLLECYSNQVLPWCHKSGKTEEVAMRFAINIWNLMETNIPSCIELQSQDLLETTMMAMRLVVGDCTEVGQSLIVQKAYNILSTMVSLPLESIILPSSKLEALQLMSAVSSKDEWLMSLFASVVIALHPQTPLPDVSTLTKLFVVFLLKGHLPAAQALASMINKWPTDINGIGVAHTYKLEEAIDVILENLSAVLFYCPLEKHSDDSLGNLSPSTIQVHAVNGLAWSGKGLLMRGHERVKDITLLLLKCLLTSQNIMITSLHQDEFGNDRTRDMHMHTPAMRSAADAFHVILSDSQVCLNKRFHARIRPLYKQRFFSSIMPVLLSSVRECNSSVARSVLYRAFGHVVYDTPLAAVVAEAKKVIPPLLDSLSVLGMEIMNKEMIYGLLLALSGILMDENGKEAVIENAHVIITHLIGLTSYPHMTLVRETAIQCVVAMSGLPHSRIYPLRLEVLRALSKSLDDRKRVVRREAVRCRQAWSSIASRSLLF